MSFAAARRGRLGGVEDLGVFNHRGFLSIAARLPPADDSTGGACGQRTVKMPFIPEAAWPGTVHMYGNLPFFLKVTTSLVVLPGWISGVLRPLILKSCAT